MNSLEIQYFLTIVKHGSFTEAAQVLSVSQPAISKQIRQLEEELGCSLFTRSGRTLSLTPAGVAYHDYFQQCRFQLDLLKNKLNAQEKDGTIIRIAYPDDVDPSHFRTRFLDAAASMPKPVHLEFACYPESELSEILEQGRCDLILTAVPLVPDRFSASGKLYDSENPLTVQPFAKIPQVLLYAASCLESTDISCFQDAFFLLPEHNISAWKSQAALYSFFDQFGFAPKIRSAANLSTILDLVAQNEGVYLTHAWCRACKLADYQVLQLPVFQTLYLCCSKTSRKPESAGLFDRLCLEQKNR